MDRIKEFFASLLQLFVPQQSNSGSKAIQVGKVHGNLTIVQVSHQAAKPVNIPSKIEQGQVLELLKSVPDHRISVLNFMQREFGTKMVIQLQSEQLYRVKRYIEVISVAEKEKA